MSNHIWNKVLAIQVKELLAKQGAPTKTIGELCSKNAKAILFVNTASN